MASESAPLKNPTPKYGATRASTRRASISGQVDLQEEKIKDGVANTMVYRASILGTWETFHHMLDHTVWGSPALWKMMRNLVVLSLCVAVLPLIMIADPAEMHPSKLTRISQFLNVVVGLLLGFFLTSSVNRWYSCVDGFLTLLDAVRNLQMQFIALGVPEEDSGRILRHAFASASLLHQQLLFDNKKLCDGFNAQEEERKIWQTLSTKPAFMCHQHPTTLLEKAEIEVLKPTRDPPSVIWTWIAALIGRLSADGWIPAMATPTYGRIMNLCQEAHGGIRQVRASICVQTPWNYAHSLAALVHINNALNAIVLGLVLGIAGATHLQRHHLLNYHGTAHLEDVQMDIENVVVTCFYCIVGPIVYQILLLIAISLAQPFAGDDAKIPMDRLLNQLEEDICDSADLIDGMSDVFDVEAPKFKEKP